jgi:hypothetical protein
MSLKSELEKLIAKALFDAASGLGKQAIRAMQGSGLTKAGTGLPAVVVGQLVEDLRATVSNLTEALSSGAASWDSAGENGSKVSFILASKLSEGVAKRNGKNWATLARQTNEGTRMVEAFQDDATFNAAANSAVPRLVEVYTRLVVGEYLPSPAGAAYGVVLLTGVVRMGVAPKDTAAFSATPIVFYMWAARGPVHENYKMAKKQAKSFFGKLKAPTWGPFLRT